MLGADQLQKALSANIRTYELRMVEQAKSFIWQAEWHAHEDDEDMVRSVVDVHRPGSCGRMMPAYDPVLRRTIIAVCVQSSAAGCFRYVGSAQVHVFYTCVRRLPSLMINRWPAPPPKQT